MDVSHFTALLGNRSNPGVALQVGGGVKTLALRPHGGQKPRSQNWAGARKAGENVMVGVLLEALGNLLFEFFDGGNDILQLPADELNPESKTAVESRFITDRNGLFDELESSAQCVHQ